MRALGITTRTISAALRAAGRNDDGGPAQHQREGASSKASRQTSDLIHSTLAIWRWRLGGARLVQHRRVRSTPVTCLTNGATSSVSDPDPQATSSTTSSGRGAIDASIGEASGRIDSSRWDSFLLPSNWSRPAACVGILASSHPLRRFVSGNAEHTRTLRRRYRAPGRNTALSMPSLASGLPKVLPKRAQLTRWAMRPELSTLTAGSSIFDNSLYPARPICSADRRTLWALHPGSARTIRPRRGASRRTIFTSMARRLPA